ncbi:glycoside hydrolase family 88 protein [Hoylesella enoeca]|uniref:Glucuronyl hydrolase n=1 Tax=Hoylesella enoeca TaxID=76123 RepID=A0A0S2KNJ0_9BACT|nr:glycoside hydrolase family 88 protein [Hoylesella enoeca]ALO49667.1 glucuronyl hydrolase [Hoylesella enoeca]
MRRNILILFFLSFLATAWPNSDNGDLHLIKQIIDNAKTQLSNELTTIDRSGKLLNPVTLTKDNKVFYCDYEDWRSGFFPGSLWYMYELTGDNFWARKANAFTQSIKQAQHLTSHHDVGFIIDSSFGNSLRLTGNPADKNVIVTAARSLLSRFRPAAGIIQSWNVDRGWQSRRGWECPVIIDNMMNLEMLFNATRLSGDSVFFNAAVSHADKTLQNQFRPDGSCYHVVDYNLTDGHVRHRQTAQGYADESIWSRGQAWAIYGYTMCYRFTGYPRYLNQAIKTFRMMKNHPAMPADCIPYWDMSAPKIPNELRDVSSAAVIASALYELCTIDLKNAGDYKTYADKIIRNLASDRYTARPGHNGNFILMHSVGSIPHNNELDKPLNYADYYYLEALVRKAQLELYFQKTCQNR